MSLRSDGAYRCDRCGTDVGNGGIDQCAHIVLLNPSDPTDIWHLHYCLPRPDPTRPHLTLPGCRDAVLTPDALTDHTRSRPS